LPKQELVRLTRTTVVAVAALVINVSISKPDDVLRSVLCKPRLRAFAAILYRQFPGSLRVVGSRKKNSHPGRSTTSLLLSFLLDSVVDIFFVRGVNNNK
jgi:hypothetical protein